MTYDKESKFCFEALRLAERSVPNPRGHTFDGLGIPPDIAVPVFADSDVTAGKDPVLAKALELLGKK